jgi:hypothetical protein
MGDKDNNFKDPRFFWHRNHKNKFSKRRFFLQHPLYDYINDNSQKIIFMGIKLAGIGSCRLFYGYNLAQLFCAEA